MKVISFNKTIFIKKMPFYEMLHVSTLKGHHQARINKKEGSQIPRTIFAMEDTFHYSLIQYS
jgi:hypothetical protein